MCPGGSLVALALPSRRGGWPTGRERAAYHNISNGDGITLHCIHASNQLNARHSIADEAAS